MPIKFRKSDVIRKKEGGYVTTHHYMSQITKERLFQLINGEENCKPKQRVKCIRELDKRGIRYTWDRTPLNLQLEQQ